MNISWIMDRICSFSKWFCSRIISQNSRNYWTFSL